MGIRDNFTEAEQEMLIASAMERKGLSREEAIRLLEARGRPANRNPFLERQWVRDLHKISVSLAQKQPHPIGLFARVFWIDLYGVLTELRERYSHAPETCEALRGIKNGHSRADALEAVHNGCEALLRALTDEEIVFITFMRQIHAHIYQDGFEYAYKKATQLRINPPQFGTVRWSPRSAGTFLLMKLTEFSMTSIPEAGRTRFNWQSTTPGNSNRSFPASNQPWTCWNKSASRIELPANNGASAETMGSSVQNQKDRTRFRDS